MGRESRDATTAHWPIERRGYTLGLRVILEGVIEHYPLPSEGDVIIGRGEGVDLEIHHSSVSRRHARIHLAGSITIEDLGSSNGTRVGERVLGAQELIEISPGEPIDIGSALVILERRFVGQQPTRASESQPVAVEAGPVVIASEGMERVRSLIDRVAPGQISVLIVGETGVGKEIVAEMVHKSSPRADKPFVRLNCGAFSESLLESEIFGHERGAFTGADRAKPGLLESAAGGTVFLDEVGELSPALQVKLLRVLEDRKVRRVGALEPSTIDVRFVSATNRDLDDAIKRGQFREDLYYRISGITIEVPPLRERRTEIRPLAELFAGRAARHSGLPAPSFSHQAMSLLQDHPWPGNIRELRNVVERAVLLSGGPITGEHLQDLAMASEPSSVEQAEPGSSGASGSTLRDDVEKVERARVIDALEACGGNQTKAARQLGISRGTLATRMARYNIPRPRK